MAKVWRASDTYEHSDFNRIESIIRAAYSQFRGSMGLYKEIVTITNRTISSILHVEDINRIESNLKYVDITGAFKEKRWAEGAVFTYEDANRWERIAEILERAIVGVQSVRCGTIRCGTWPHYSVIGLVVNNSDLYSAEVKTGTYTVIPAGTQPEYSIIGLVVDNTITVQGDGATAAFEAPVCGTQPDISEIGIAIDEVVRMTYEGSSGTFAMKAAGMKHCGEEV